MLEEANSFRIVLADTSCDMVSTNEKRIVSLGRRLAGQKFKSGITDVKVSSSKTMDSPQTIQVTSDFLFP
jgi:hypothetical protein